MPQLSVIIPFINEWPQLIWTVRSIAEELRDRVDFEIIAINNHCKQNNREEDKGGKYLENVSKGQKWLKILSFEEKLSHWNAKRIGVLHSAGKFLFFNDAHCAVGRDGLFKAFSLYESSHKALNGSLHMPLTYQILEWRKLIYKLVADPTIAKVHYSFTPYRDNPVPYEVPCMSTCGMLITRAMYDELGGWPKELGIYGGGENFINFAGAVLGYKRWIMPGEPLYHHGDRRGYSYNYTDYVRNQLIASYLYGGVEWSTLLRKAAKGRPEVLKKIHDDVLETCRGHRKMLKSKQKLTIGEWLEKWMTK